MDDRRKIQRLMFDNTEKFINEIREQPSLWDKRLPQYTDKSVRDACWSSIGHEMFEDWDDITFQEKEERVIQMKKKWRHERDYFLRLTKSEHAAPKKKPKKTYVFAECLSFLKEVMDLDQRQPKQRPASSLQRDEEMIEDLAEINVEEDEMSIEIHEPRSLRNMAAKKRTLSPNGEPETAENHRKYPKTTTSNKTCGEDVDRYFLLSMLEDFKSLTENEKLDFKIMSLQFFKNVRQRRELINLGMPLHQNGKQSQHFSGQSNSNNRGRSHSGEDGVSTFLEES